MAPSDSLCEGGWGASATGEAGEGTVGPAERVSDENVVMVVDDEVH